MGNKISRKMTTLQFTCGLDGYLSMIDHITSLLFLAITVNSSIIEFVISGLADLAMAYRLFMKFIRSANSWIGYLIGALYYFGLEFGYADVTCELSKYGYEVIYWLNFAITFGQGSG